MIQQAFSRVVNTSALLVPDATNEMQSQLARTERTQAHLFSKTTNLLPSLQALPRMFQYADARKCEISGVKKPSLMKTMALVSCVFVASPKDFAGSSDIFFVGDKPPIAVLILPSARRVHAQLMGDSTLLQLNGPGYVTECRSRPSRQRSDMSRGSFLELDVWYITQCGF